MMGSNSVDNLGGGGSLEEVSCGVQPRRLWRSRNEGPLGRGSFRGRRRVRFGSGVPAEFGGLC